MVKRVLVLDVMKQSWRRSYRMFGLMMVQPGHDFIKHQVIHQVVSKRCDDDTLGLEHLPLEHGIWIVGDWIVRPNPGQCTGKVAHGDYWLCFITFVKRDAPTCGRDSNVRADVLAEGAESMEGILILVSNLGVTSLR